MSRSFDDYKCDPEDSTDALEFDDDDSDYEDDELGDSWRDEDLEDLEDDDDFDDDDDWDDDDAMCVVDEFDDEDE